MSLEYEKTDLPVIRCFFYLARLHKRAIEHLSIFGDDQPI
jgi:hypothetical protein